MNGRHLQNSSCPYCGARSLYGAAPLHAPNCSYPEKTENWKDEYKRDVSLLADRKTRNCECGHWSGHHSFHPKEESIRDWGCYGCLIEGCKCELDCFELAIKANAKPKECDCGGKKIGYPPGIMHSHWGHPNNKDKWCPLRSE